MKILLIYPYCQEERRDEEDVGVPPIGIYYVGALLRKHRYDAEVLNWHGMRERQEHIAAFLEESHPDVIGFSVLNANRWGAIDIARMAKKIDPGVKIVFGGIGATHLWRLLLTHFPEIDAVVLGEGEHTFLDLVRRYEHSRGPGPASVKGTAYRDDGGRPVTSPPRDLIADLDTLPDPATYFTFQHLVFTRGCVGRCTFCGSPAFWGHKVRSHSAPFFVTQLQRLHEKGVSFFFVSDDTFTLERERVIAVCREIIDRGLRITWAAISRVDSVDETLLRWMRRAGCIQISYGVESGSEKQRRFLNKPISRSRILRAFRLTQSYGIMARAYFIYGFPGETVETIRETLDLMDRIGPLSALFYILDIFPGTDLYAAYKKQAGVSDDIWLNHIEDIMYFETDPGIDGETVAEFGKMLRRHFHRHLPEYADRIELVDDEKLYPLHADFCSRLAMTFDQGDYATVDAIPEKAVVARKFYRKALRYHPNPRAYLGLGMMAQRARQFEASIEILEAGISRFPKESRLAICLAVSHMNLGAFAKALELLLKFRKKQEALPFIAACYEALGEREKAARYAQMAAKGP